MTSLSSAEASRYARHIILPEVGRAGQERLKASSVLIVGAGGLGSPASMYLAAAGVGRIGIVDFDVVDESNLQRQLLYSASDVGRPKVVAARDRLVGLNPHIDIVSHEMPLRSDNAIELMQAYDLVLDGTDNFPTRYLVNDACVLSRTPNVYGSIFRFEGQCSLFAAPGGPCYRCLYPEPPEPHMVPNCAEGGVLGVLPGLVGTLQATEAIKWIVGVGTSLVGRLMLVDTLSMDVRTVAISRSASCPACGDQPTITAPVDIDWACEVEPEPADHDYEIAPVEVKRRLDAGETLTMIDVREPAELDICSIDGAVLVPMATIPDRIGDFDRDAELIVICRSGSRSGSVVRYLLSQGFRRPRNMVGGVLEWSDTVDPTMAKY